MITTAVYCLKTLILLFPVILILSLHLIGNINNIKELRFLLNLWVKLSLVCIDQMKKAIVLESKEVTTGVTTLTYL